MVLALSLFGVILSMVVIWRASDGFEAASNYLGRNLSDGVRGATINAIGSSLPELLTTSIALLLYMNRDGFAFGIGTTAGSAIFNSAVIPSLVILTVVLTKTAKHIAVSKKVVWRDGISLLLCEAVLILILSGGTLDWYHGLILIGLYVAYITTMLLTMGEGNESCENEGNEEGEVNQKCWVCYITLDLRRALLGSRPLSGPSATALIVVAATVIGTACWFLVESCYALGEILQIRIYFIAVILAAAATSVPDTILSIKDAKAGNYDDAVSNALGSNIFDICVCLGLPLCIFSLLHGPITLDISDGSVAELRVLLIALTGLTFLVFVLGRAMGLVKGLILLGIYISFVLYIYLRATGNEWAIEIGNQIQALLSFFHIGFFPC
jgi:cation:H+ antiporter